MANDTRTEEKPVEKEQDEAMSTSEQNTVDKSGDSTADESQVTEPKETEELALPDEAKDRTKEQFDKLKTQLRDERVAREEAEALTANQFLQQPVSGTQNPIYDATTGIVDVAELERLRSSTADAQAATVKSDRKLEKYIAQQQEEQAFAIYPELDSKNTDYNKNFAGMAGDLVMGSIMNPKKYGGELSLKAAADMLRGMSDKERKAAEKKGATKAVEVLTPKEQASLEATGRSDRRTDVEVDYNALRVATRRGDKEATIARLRALSASKG